MLEIMQNKLKFYTSLEQRASFLESKGPHETNRLILWGLPSDSSTCFRPGARFGPKAIRDFSENLESFSPYWRQSLNEVPFADVGDLPLPRTNNRKAYEKIYEATNELLEAGFTPISLGGDHSVSYPLISSFSHFYADLAIVQLDAHADLRTTYEGEKYSHACSMGNSLELFPSSTERLFQFGVRSFSQEEFSIAQQNRFSFSLAQDSLTEARELLGKRHVYLTIDLDVFDPSVFPGTGTPEAGGWHYQDFETFLDFAAELNLVGADIVELSPPYDPTGISAALAAKTTREVLLLLHGHWSRP